MAVLVVVVGEEDLAEGAGAGEGSELAGERRAVLECLELRFAERIIVRHVRPGMALADVQVGEQHGDRLGRHRRAPVRMTRLWRPIIRPLSWPGRRAPNSCRAVHSCGTWRHGTSTLTIYAVLTPSPS